MRIARFTTGDDPKFAVIEGDESDGTAELAVIAGDPLFTPLHRTGERLPLDGTADEPVRLLAPVIPRSKVVGIGRNYADHIAEMGNDTPSAPVVFFKPNTSVVGPGDPIVRPPDSEIVHYEGELAIVIGRVAKQVPKDRAGEVIIGYTCANDVSERVWQREDGQWWRAKGSDTFCPLGPVLHTGLSVEEAGDLAVTTTLDGATVQSGRTSQMIFDIPSIIEFVTATITLLPGDVILTGTPSGVGPIAAGQRVEVTLERIGTLSNPVVQG